MVFLFMMTKVHNLESPKKGHFDGKKAGSSTWKRYSNSGCMFTNAYHHNLDNWSGSFGKNIRTSLDGAQKPENSFLSQIDRK
jgi:hypothetical protein